MVDLDSTEVGQATTSQDARATRLNPYEAGQTEIIPVTASSAGLSSLRWACVDGRQYRLRAVAGLGSLTEGYPCNGSQVPAVSQRGM